MDLFHVILVEPRYDGNIGSVARIMKNFGFKNLVLVNPPKIGAEGRKNSMHARDLMDSAKVYPSFKEAAEEYDFLVATTAKLGGDSNRHRTPVYPEALGKALKTKGKIAIVFGREDYGLLNDEIKLCDLSVTIPANPEYPTLNLAQSVAVILYELSKQKRKTKTQGKKFLELSKTEKQYLLKFYDELVDNTLSHDFEATLSKWTFRQVIGRAFISGREARTLTGTFRTAREKLSGKRQ
jgi:tRNA/rRNA methyltransferase